MTERESAISRQGDPDRREFVQAAAGTVIAASLSGPVKADDGDVIPRRPLGKTGEKVSCLGLGGYHVGTVASKEVAARIIHEAIDAGVNFLDNAWE